MAGPKQTVFIGDVFPTQNHGNIEVVKYEGTTKVTVRFEDGTTRLTHVSQIRNRSVKNNFQPIINGVGYLGTDHYLYSGKTIKVIPEYVAWVGMLRRCYDVDHLEKFPNYVGCTVTKDWHNFSIFAEWYKLQVGYGKKWHVDKDHTVLGNKVYSPETCSLVPPEVNNLLLDRRALRGDCPIGVHYSAPHGKYIAQAHSGNKSTYIGIYLTPEDAFAAYKVVKESYVKVVAEKYKDVLSDAVYNTLTNYVVLITD